MTSSALHLEVEPRGARLAAPVASVLGEALSKGFPSSFNLAIVDRRGTSLRAWGGDACRVGEVVAATRDTIYDLASLTKVVATTTLASWLCDQGRWRLEDRVINWLPELQRGDLTLSHLLTHTSGLIPHRPFFQLGPHPREVRRAVIDEARRGGPPGAVAYSDLNFMLLGWAIERCAGEHVDQLFRRVVTAPLGLATTRFRPPARWRLATAATELDGDQRLEPGLVWGEVHDGNAWSLGGVAGHAGLFASADDLASFSGALLHPTRNPILSARSIKRFSTQLVGDVPAPDGLAGRAPTTSRPNAEPRSVGWRVSPTEWGPWPASTFWHTGFTGTSLLVAPELASAVVLLTNAIHPVRKMAQLAEFRARVHSQLAEIL